MSGSSAALSHAWYNDLNRFEFPVRDNPKCKESVVAWRLTRAELEEVFSEE